MIHEKIYSPDKITLALKTLAVRNLSEEVETLRADRRELIDAMSRLIIACEDLANDDRTECFFCDEIYEHKDTCPFFRAVEVLDSLWWSDYECKAL